ncbi:MAG: SIR2 family protein [Burkholderiales bacterium]|nr:SIR2 family protein [Burkholderiales bacterium]
MNNPKESVIPSAVSHLSLRKGNSEFLIDKSGVPLSWDLAVSATSQQLSEALGARHVAFLLGAGASSLMHDTEQLGIPTMAPLAKEFAETTGVDPKKHFLTANERTLLADRYGLSVEEPPYNTNLEKLMEVLFSLQFVLASSSKAADADGLTLVRGAIDKVKSYVLDKCTKGAFSSSGGDKSVLQVYKNFYRKLVIRDRSLPRQWVFTTNYDLFNETALDQLGMQYCNGFSGTIERRFNPAIYRYALAEQIDLSQRRWAAVDGFIYLCKLHGSVSWIEDSHGLYPIRELQEPSSSGQVMIYPTPAKQNSSFGAPYSDLFREFQGRIAREQSVLVTIGYGFGDEHVNNIIYQSLTIPTFRLVIFAPPDANAELQKLSDLNDPRIWMISGLTPEGKRAHYFETVVEQLLPALPSDRVDQAIAKVVDLLIRPQDPGDGTNHA